ncbi:nucleolar preribosomal associated cytoplasmic ATPase, putative [Plasmodium berghei]|uniref:GPN-loop GTPase 3 n=8 Tax=Plasmodium berghei TaxID=5821 RepID=A0A509AQP9_PLABA|nr:GPN-loop GTPase, putative [Plasmodium berghei ANKA]CXJ05248.1 nucleolar preribosomal associated cytoplasmic ATPase, putative [Plasmodium berghei]SCL98785.1 nucleolar preribosomal associated cytoplasmic ATPase, putative [Plasmodium berghei]SCM16899.1 nucleolar preribosomal associated cytoplasmic ATPase, putative [Plasmodium berghei]SCM18697.1 nucleolar preribosomal associated cytoplasmic ATPase, putative [Plasmodium berghei]SCN28132.1 nucleolar preribosomal associated cytoplasmic ATPase, put|eukprot:XP_034423782.1 GPN-loop GTPase, putative [Plasmodium berghei ANKA]
MKYGQVVVGPAGSGKTNYCKLMKEFMKIKKRNCYVVNLDSANEEYYYEKKKKAINTTSNIEKELNDYYNTIYDIDIRNYVDVNSLMEEEMLGPNCALLKSIELLYENSNLLEDELNNYDDDDNYFIIDTPGQIELYTHTDYFKKILDIFTYQNIKLIVVFLIDISFISSNTKLLSAYLTSLSTMINFELPHINILTKCDLLVSKNYYEEFKKFKYNNNFFFQKKLYRKINKKLKKIKNSQKKRDGFDDDHNNSGENYDDSFFKELEYINNTDELSFKEEYILGSDYTSRSGSSLSYASLSDGKNKYDTNLSENNSSDVSDEIEEKIYKKNYDKLNDILSLDPHDIIITASKCMSKKYYRLNSAFANIIEDFNLVSFIPLNIYDDDNVDFIINSIDVIIQYGEDKDVNDNYDM